MADIIKPPHAELLYWTLLEGLAKMWVNDYDEADYDKDVRDELMNGIHLLRKHLPI